jgi:hypothetical protein
MKTYIRKREDAVCILQCDSIDNSLIGTIIFNRSNWECLKREIDAYFNSKDEKIKEKLVENE